MSNLIKNFKKYDLGIKGVRLPSFDIPLEEKKRVGVDKDCSNFDFLKALWTDKLKEIKTQVSSKSEKRN